jgi:hypothetical protein
MRWSTFCETKSSLATQQIPCHTWNLKIPLHVQNILELQITSYKWGEKINEIFLEIMKRIFVKYINQFASA